MGIDVAAFEFLLRAHRDLGAFGKTVILGRQRLLVRTDADRQRFESVLAAYRPDLTLADVEHTYVDRLIEHLGGSPSHVLDNSAYEGAQVIHDLNEPLPAETRSAYDTVIDIGTLEHVFNIGTAMKSVAEMVRPGGQFLCLNVANQHLGHGFWQFGPEVFFRTFCEQHGYEPRSAELYYGGAFHPLRDPEEAGRRLPMRTPGYTYITFTARKVRNVPVFADGWPVQADYAAAWTTFQARQAARQNDPAAAERLLRAAIDEHPANPIYRAELSRILRLNGDLNGADAQSRAAVAMADDNAAVERERAAVLAELARSTANAPAEPRDGGAQTLTVGGVTVIADDPCVSDAVRQAITNGRYEFKERELARRVLAPGDRVIELGAGIGIVSATLARLVGPTGRVSAFEANPNVHDALARNLALNGCAVTVHHTIAVPRSRYVPGETVPFYAFRAYAASSTHQISDRAQPIAVPTVCLEDEIAVAHANVLVMDIEGGEDAIVMAADLSGIDKLVMELHPKILGAERCAALIDRLDAAGLRCRTDLLFGDVVAHQRDAPEGTTAAAPGSLFLAANAVLSAIEADPSSVTDHAATLPPALQANGYVQRAMGNAFAAINPVRAEDCLDRARALGNGDFLLEADFARRAIVRRDVVAARRHLERLVAQAPGHKVTKLLVNQIAALEAHEAPA